MTRTYRLIRYEGEWQVCSKARRAASGKTYLCWIYGPARIEFCRVGDEEVVTDLPGTNFFGDQFPFTVQTRHRSVDHWERLAGARNIIIANQAYDTILATLSEGMMLRLRHGSRIIREDSPLDKPPVSR